MEIDDKKYLIKVDARKYLIFETNVSFKVEVLQKDLKILHDIYENDYDRIVAILKSKKDLLETFEDGYYFFEEIYQTLDNWHEMDEGEGIAFDEMIRNFKITLEALYKIERSLPDVILKRKLNDCMAVLTEVIAVLKEGQRLEKLFDIGYFIGK